MIVTVVDRSGWGTSGAYPAFQTVKIADACPECGGPRGKPYNYNFSEDGGFYSCYKWDNPCGHVDKYGDVLNEARRLISSK